MKKYVLIWVLKAVLLVLARAKQAARQGLVRHYFSSFQMLQPVLTQCHNENRSAIDYSTIMVYVRSYFIMKQHSDDISRFDNFDL